MPGNEMGPSGTGLEVVVLITGTAVAVLYAWWMSNRETRRFRRLVEWLRQHHDARCGA